MLEITQDYSQIFAWLNQFDNNSLAAKTPRKEIIYAVQDDEAKVAIAERGICSVNRQNRYDLTEENS